MIRLKGNKITDRHRNTMYLLYKAYIGIFHFFMAGCDNQSQYQKLQKKLAI